VHVGSELVLELESALPLEPLLALESALPLESVLALELESALPSEPLLALGSVLAHSREDKVLQWEWALALRLALGSDSLWELESVLTSAWA
jgi:hypothetical protein